MQSSILGRRLGGGGSDCSGVRHEPLAGPARRRQSLPSRAPATQTRLAVLVGTWQRETGPCNHGSAEPGQVAHRATPFRALTTSWKALLHLRTMFACIFILLPLPYTIYLSECSVGRAARKYQLAASSLLVSQQPLQLTLARHPAHAGTSPSPRHQKSIVSFDSTSTIKRVLQWTLALSLPVLPLLKIGWLCCRLQSYPHSFETSCPILACVCVK